VEVVEQDPNEDRDDDEKIPEKDDDLPGIGTSKFRLYKCSGYVRKETGDVFKGVKTKRGYAFRVETPDIEEKSTNTLEIDGSGQTLNLDIPHNEPHPSLTC